MGRVLAIDYGRKRCGVAVTDILKIAANGLSTQRTCDLEKFLLEYCSNEPVERIIIGHPRTVRGEDSESMQYIRPFMNRLAKLLPAMPGDRVADPFTSVHAHRDLITARCQTSARQRKELADEMSAVLILTSWLENPRL